MEEISHQYEDVISEGRRLGIQATHLAAFETYYKKYQ